MDRVFLGLSGLRLRLSGRLLGILLGLTAIVKFLGAALTVLRKPRPSLLFLKNISIC